MKIEKGEKQMMLLYFLFFFPCVTNMFSFVRSFGDNDKVPLAFFPLPHLNVDHI